PATGRGAPITMDAPFAIHVDYWNLLAGARLHVVLHVITEQEVIAFATGSSSDDRWRDRELDAGLYRATCRIPGHLLNSGRHRFRVFIVRDLGTLVFHYDSQVCFDVIDARARGIGWHGKEPGAVQPRLEWTHRSLAGADVVDIEQAVAFK